MNRLKNILSKKYVYIPLIALVLIIGGWWVANSRKQGDYTTIQAARADFVQVISVTGKVVPADDVELSFETAGKVGRVNVKVGDLVKRGQTLATLGGGDAYASLVGARARLETEQIKLRNLQSGNRPEEIKIKQTALDSAKVAETQAEESLKNDIIDSYTASDDFIKNEIDAFFHRDGTLKEDIIPFGDAELKKSLDTRKRGINQMLIKWEDSIQQLQAGSYDTAHLNEAMANLQTLRLFLNDVAIAVSQFTPSPTLTQSTIDQYKSGVSASRATVNSSIAALNSGKDTLKTAGLDIKTAEDNMALSKAGADPYDIEAQRAVIKGAEASVLEASAAVNKTVITAPFDGIITKVDITAGGSASPSISSISLISAANFEIESFIAEADISKVHINDNAKVTLDAYGGETFFDAVITKIDPAETLVESVSTYRTTLQFTKQDERIKSGMTANIDVQGQIRPNILSVPQSALIYDDDNKKTIYILKDDPKKPEERSVRTGQTDDKGNVEIIEGVAEGEKVVTNPPR